ncbi:MAG: hypothetical protein P4L51_14850, partial [Puia sp.]|nr:hypothetical protein [Puia sp.]
PKTPKPQNPKTPKPLSLALLCCAEELRQNPTVRIIPVKSIDMVEGLDHWLEGLKQSKKLIPEYQLIPLCERV